MMEFSDAASIATMILFIIYFIGRIMTIIFIKRIVRDKISVEKDLANYDIVDEYIIDNNGQNVILNSVEGIRKIKIIKCHVYDGKLIVDEKQIEYKFLNIGHSLHIKVTLPEIFPEYLIEYYTYDYMKVDTYLSENLKSGVLSESMKPHHTFLSILYHLFM